MIVNGVKHQDGCCCHLCKEEKNTVTHLSRLRRAAMYASADVTNAMAASMAAKRRYREAVLRESRNAYVSRITWKEWKKREERRKRMEELWVQNVVRRLYELINEGLERTRSTPGCE